MGGEDRKLYGKVNLFPMIFCLRVQVLNVHKQYMQSALSQQPLSLITIFAQIS